MSSKATLIGATIARGGFGKVYKVKIMNDADNERKIIVKVLLRAGVSMEKKEAKMGEIIKTYNDAGKAELVSDVYYLWNFV
jgi:hypothetical protein